ncbi:hypothetical protein HAX54_048339, partial [Datura stramonium]|nr:hypothetical protein [Datura stramonium]
GGEKGERGREVGSGGFLVGLGGFAGDGEEKEETTAVGVVAVSRLVGYYGGKAVVFERSSRDGEGKRECRLGLGNGDGRGGAVVWSLFGDDSVKVEGEKDP